MVVSLNGYETKPIDAGVVPSRQISIYEDSYLAPKLVGIKQILLKKWIIYCEPDKTTSFVLFPQASQLSMNFHISKLVFWLDSSVS